MTAMRMWLPQVHWSSQSDILITFYFWCLGYFTNNRWLYLNTGLSSGINWGRKLLTEEADIVTAHGKETV